MTDQPNSGFNRLAALATTAIALAAGAGTAHAQTPPDRAAARAEMDAVRKKMEEFKRQHGRMPNPQEFAEMRGKPATPPCPGLEAGQPQRKPEEIMADARRAQASGDLEAARRAANPALLACTEAAMQAGGAGKAAADAAVQSIESLTDPAACEGARNFYKDKLTSPLYGPEGGARIGNALKNCGRPKAPGS